MRRSAQRYLRVGEAAQPGRDRRPINAQHARVTDHRDVAAELDHAAIEIGLQVRAPDLLLALDNDRHRHWRPARRRVPGAESREPGHHLPLVVHRAARHHAPAVRPVDEGRLERRPRPGSERLRRLDIVMAVKQHARSGAGARMAGPHDRQPRRLVDADGKADPLQPFGQPRRGTAAVGRVRRLRAHARYLQPIGELSLNRLTLVFKHRQDARQSTVRCAHRAVILCRARHHRC